MYRMIIVEDERSIRNGLVQFIPWEEIGFTVVKDFSCGDDALGYLRDDHVDVVLTDVKMERGSGIDIAQYLKENSRLESVIFYSAYKNFEYACLGLEYGVRLYITKDMGFHEIIKSMKNLRAKMDTEFHIQLPGRESRKSEDRIAILRAYLAKNYKSATLESSARVLRINPSYLSSYVKRTTGKNFGSFLTETRMEKAAELLTSTSYKVVEICSMVGYSDVRHFIKIFSKLYNISPGKYRKRAKNPEAGQ